MLALRMGVSMAVLETEQQPGSGWASGWGSRRGKRRRRGGRGVNLLVVGLVVMVWEKERERRKGISVALMASMVVLMEIPV